MFLSYDIVHRLLCNLLAICGQAANISTHEPEGLRLLGSWMCCLPDPFANGRMMLCAVGWLGGEMICGAGVLRPSALVTRSAKSLVVDIITFLSRCMMASRFVYGAVFPAVSPGRCVKWCLCAVGWVRGEMVHRAVDFRHSALDTRSAKSLVVLSSTVVMPSGVCCYVLLVLYVASLWVCGGMSVFG